MTRRTIMIMRSQVLLALARAVAALMTVAAVWLPDR